MSRKNGVRARGRRQINKGLSPTTLQAIKGMPAGMQPRGFSLMDAINTATARLSASGMAGTFEPLPRDPLDTTAFGPLSPLTPDPVDPLRRDTERVEPRVFEYQNGWNLPGAGGRETPWQVLRAAADGISIVRNCIEIRKRHMRTLRWEIAPARDAVIEAYRADPSRSQDGIEAEMRDRLTPEINRLREFWKKPWHSNDWRLGQWINAVMEELLVLDAVTVYPRMNYGGQVLDLELVDGTTIKPLLDWRGARPLPPFAAFQQILYGFPRGEWTASSTRDAEGNEIVENGFAAGELFYYRENVRAFTPYGYPPVERALMDSRIWLKRFGWLLAEYEDGSTPVTFIETAEAQDGQRLDVLQRRRYEDALNDELVGQTRRRNRMKVLPNQWKPHQLTTAPERYRPEYDLFVIKLISSVFGVTIAEHGFTEPGGLGSTGWHEGQAEVTGRVGTRPDVEILSDIVNDVSRQFQRMPPELEFRFVDPAGQNDKDSDGVADAQVKSGRITINDDRRRLGLAVYGFPEADMPMIITATGPVFLEGSFQRAQEAAEAAKQQQLAGADAARGKLEIEGAKLEDAKEAREEGREFERERMDRAEVTEAQKMAELGAFRTWRRRNPAPRRPFTFKAITPDDGFPELDDLTPDIADFGPDWEWLIDVGKGAMTWVEWNALHPNRPRGPNGRWVERKGLADDLKKELERTAPPTPKLSAKQAAAQRSRHALALGAIAAELREIGHQGASAEQLKKRFGALHRAADPTRNPEKPAWATVTGLDPRTMSALATLHDELEMVDTPEGVLAAVDHRLQVERIELVGAPDDELAYDPAIHRLDLGDPATDAGRMGFVLRPGVRDLETGRLLERAQFTLLPEQPKELRPPTWEELGSPTGPSPVGQKIGYMGGTYERLPGEPRRYRVINARGEDISDQVIDHTAEDARTALRMEAGDRERTDKDARSTWRKAMAAVPGTFDMRTKTISGFDGATPEQREAIRGALVRWKDDIFDFSYGVEPTVNAAQRGRTPHTPTTRADVAALRLGFQLSRTKRAMKLHRGVGNGAHILPADWETRDLTGHSWTDEGFSATSADIEAAENYVGQTENQGFGISFRWPKDSPAIALVDAPGSLDAEGEVIIPDEATFKIVKDRKRKGMRWFDVDVTYPDDRLPVDGPSSNMGDVNESASSSEPPTRKAPKGMKALPEKTHDALVRLGERKAELVQMQLDDRKIRVLDAREMGIPRGVVTRLERAGYVKRNANMVSVDSVTLTEKGYAYLAALRDDMAHEVALEHIAALEQGINQLRADLAANPRWSEQLRSLTRQQIDRHGAELARLKLDRALLFKAPTAPETRKAVTPDEFERGAPALEGNADPKAQAPIPPDQRWPGWAVDAAIAAAVVPQLLSAMSAGVRVGALINLLRSWLDDLARRPGDPVPDVRPWLESTGTADQLRRALTPAIQQAHIEGWMVGQRSADAVLDWVREHDQSARNAVEISVNWGDWEPGHPEAARLLIEPGGLQSLLQQSNVQIRSIVDNRLDDIGQIIGRGLERGDAPKTIARALENLVGSRANAERIAITETNRAMSAASVESYRRAGCWGKGWMTAYDQHVCATCEANERNPDGTPRVVPIDALFPSGDPWPPAHPRCRCAPIPIFELTRGR